MLARQRMLDVAQPGVSGSIGIRLSEPSVRFGVARLKRIEPALRLLLEALEVATDVGGGTRIVVRHTFLHDAWCPLSTGRRKGERDVPSLRFGWEDSLAADRRRPNARFWKCLRLGAERQGRWAVGGGRGAVNQIAAHAVQ